MVLRNSRGQQRAVPYRRDHEDSRRQPYTLSRTFPTNARDVQTWYQVPMQKISLKQYQGERSSTAQTRATCRPVLSRMCSSQLTLHNTHWPDTSRFASRLVQASNVCLWSVAKPGALRSGIVGMRGSIYGHSTIIRPCITMTTPPTCPSLSCRR